MTRDQPQTLPLAALPCPARPGQRRTHLRHLLLDLVELVLEALVTGHDLLAARAELAGEEAGEVALQESEDEDVANGREGREEDDREGHERQHVPRRAAEGRDLPGLQSAPHGRPHEHAPGSAQVRAHQPARSTGWGRCDAI